MRLELHNDVEGQPPYTTIPHANTSGFKKFCRSQALVVSVESKVFRGNGVEYDFVHFSHDCSTADLRKLIKAWNVEQRAAKRANAAAKAKRTNGGKKKI